MNTVLGIRKRVVAIGLLFVCALLVGFAGIFFSGCNKVDTSNIVEEDAPDMVTLEDWGYVASSSQVNKFTLNGKDGDVFFCYDKSGGLQIADTGTGLSSKITLKSGEAGYWYFWRSDGSLSSDTYIDIEWKGQVGNSYGVCFGYAVIKVKRNSDSTFTAEVIKSVTFPKVNGEYQDVTREQVVKLIDKAKK